MRVRNVEDGVVHYARARWKSKYTSALLCEPVYGKVHTYSAYSGYFTWENTRLPVTCPNCLALAGGRAEPRQERTRRAGRRGLSDGLVVMKVPESRSGTGRIKTNGWNSMTRHKFGKRVTHKESRQRSRNILREWDE